MCMRRISRGKYSSEVRPLIEIAPVPSLMNTRALARLRRPVA